MDRNLSGIHLKEFLSKYVSRRGHHWKKLGSSEQLGNTEERNDISESAPTENSMRLLITYNVQRHLSDPWNWKLIREGGAVADGAAAAKVNAKLIFVMDKMEKKKKEEEKRGPKMKTIEVVLNDRLGKKVEVKCNEDNTIGDLKKLVAAYSGIRVDKIRI
ncbi:hypothetical protein RJ639_006320 [Escallonia herrerae]|uniref:Ubiquitin-like domain-containing protein n=1 Tax=Escallonia herrerae TaxID=1293975 RepID=A0AA89AW21_9ASTE|nr:hypothetical protein RJ639_006320 [Escallonia herrerae]